MKFEICEQENRGMANIPCCWFCDSLVLFTRMTSFSSCFVSVFGQVVVSVLLLFSETAWELIFVVCDRIKYQMEDKWDAFRSQMQNFLAISFDGQ